MQPVGSGCGRASFQHALATVWQPGASLHVRINTVLLIKVGDHVCRGVLQLGIDEEKGGVGVWLLGWRGGGRCAEGDDGVWWAAGCKGEERREVVAHADVEHDGRGGVEDKGHGRV